MPFPFGVSVGDFIACIDLIRTVVESLQGAHGSAAQYRSLIASLESLESALIRVRDVNIHDPTLRMALHRVAIKSRSSLSTFLAKIEKYQPSLRLGSSASCFKDNIRKIQWAVYAKEDIAIFQNEISGHVQAIVLLLLTFQTSNIEAVSVHVDQLATAAMQQQRVENRSLQLLIYVGLMHCASEIRGLGRMILLANLALFHALVKSARCGWGIPMRIGLGEYAILEDAFGRQMPISTQFVSDWTIFNTVLRHNFAKDSELPNFARTGQYVLRYLPSLREVPRGTPFSLAFRPGARLVMTLIMMYDESYADSCPHCRAPDTGVEAVTQRCSCGTAYTRAKDPTSHVLMLPSHSSVLEKLGSRRVESSASLEADNSTGTPNVEHINDADLCGDLAVPLYDDINAKNVDFSTPAMVIVTDLLGYLYSVPWRKISGVDGLYFFLQFFTAGGSILEWQDDYRIVDDTELEITPENWTEVAYPGISLKLYPCHQEFGHNLCHIMVTKIKAECLACLSKTPRIDLDSLISHLCLAIGAFDSQRQLRQLIVDTATTLCPDDNRAGLVNSSRPITAIQCCACLICHKQFSTSISLAKHIQLHLIALRCPSLCVSCDEGSLPYFMGEIVSERGRNCEDRAAIASICLTKSGLGNNRVYLARGPHHSRSRLRSVNSAFRGRFTASQQRKPQSLDMGHAGARQVTIGESQQDLLSIEQSRWSLRNSCQRHGQVKTCLADAKRWTNNARSEHLDPHMHWSVHTMSLHQLSWAYTHRPTLELPVPPRNGPAPGSWVCCACRQTNNPATCPSRCPFDGHLKCRNCYVYPRPAPSPAPRPTQPNPRRGE